MEGQSPGNAAAIPVPVEDETMSLLSNPVVGEPTAVSTNTPRDGEVMPLSQENLAMLAAQNDPRIMHVGAVSEQRLATGNVPGLGSMNSWNMVPGLSTPAYSPTERAPSVFSPTFNAQNIDRRQLQVNQVDARQLALSQVDVHVNADTGPAVAMAAEARHREIVGAIGEAHREEINILSSQATSKVAQLRHEYTVLQNNLKQLESEAATWPRQRQAR